MALFNRRLKSLCEFFNGLLMMLAFVAGGLVVILMLSITYEIVMRYFFMRPTVWANDVSGYILFVVTFLVAPWVLKEEGHVSIDIFTSRLSLRVQAATKFVTSLVGLVICGVFAWKGYEAAWVSYQMGYQLIRGIVIPQHILLWFLPIGMSLLCVQFGIRAWRSLLGFDTLAEG